MAEIWHRRRDLKENRRPYDAFSHYRDMPPGSRSFDGAYRIHLAVCRHMPVDEAAKREAPGAWRAYKTRFQWFERVDAYDAQMETNARVEKTKAIEEMNDRHARLATAFLSRIVQRLNELMEPGKVLELSPSQMILWLDKATVVERRARGEASEIVEQRTPDDILARLSDEELELARELARKAQGVKDGE